MEQESNPRAASAQAREAIVGIDVAKAKLDIALKQPKGKWKTKVVDNTPSGFEQLRAWLAKHGVSCAHVCMEATGRYGVIGFKAPRHRREFGGRHEDGPDEHQAGDAKVR